jgi:hypothetical protein
MRLPTIESVNVFFLRPSVRDDPSMSGRAQRAPMLAALTVGMTMALLIGAVIGFALGRVAQ